MSGKLKEDSMFDHLLRGGQCVEAGSKYFGISFLTCEF